MEMNDIYSEEGYSVLSFDDYNLLERHGVLSGDKSCSKFASHLLDFMELLDKKNIKKANFIVHSNQYSPEHQENIDKKIYDFSDDFWDLPEWANWEMVVHYGEYEDDDSTNASMNAENLSAHLYTKKASGIKSRISYSATIQHEMKHYFNRVIEFGNEGKNNADLTVEVNKINKRFKQMDNNDPSKNLYGYFNYFFYSTSEDEMSAWLEQSRDAGDMAKYLKDSKIDYSDYKGKGSLYSFYKKVIESIILWKDDESQRDKIDKIINLGDIKNYDEFKKFILDNFGKYLSMRFKKEASFEKYMKGYIKILDKQIKKHMKIWADGFQGIDLNEDPKEIKDILIKKREERLERIRKKKEESK